MSSASSAKLRWWLFYCLVFIVSTATAVHVEVKGTGKAIVGARVNFSAIFFTDDNDAEYKFIWQDNANPPNSMSDDTKRRLYSNWSIVYSNTTQPALYRITVEVKKFFIFYWLNVSVGSYEFELTEDLNADLQLIQDEIKREAEFVSTKTTVNHTIALDASDEAYLRDKAVYVETYWFQNCTYLGMKRSLSYEALYPQTDETYDIEALVVASFEKLPDPTPSTTTTTTTTTTTSTTTSTTTTTTPKPTTSTTPSTTTTTTPKTTTTTKSPTTSTTLPPSHQQRRRREVNDIKTALNQTAHATAALLGFNLTTANTSSTLINPPIKISKAAPSTRITHHALQESMLRPDPPYNCVNKSFIYRDPKKVYGFYKRKLVTKNPLANFTSSGKTWLQHGHLLNLDIGCQGSGPVEFCTLIYSAPYNATGNETCYNYYPMPTCKFLFTRYFSEDKTVLFFLRNQVSLSVNQVTIKLYEVKRQSQLSVVVVPVAFTLVAVILVVFGVSYYVQSRNRFTVEVADFHFGDTQSVDMEYKTFYQRLIDSILDIIPRRQRLFSESSSSDIGPEPDSPSGLSHSGAVNSSLRYDSMT